MFVRVGLGDESAIFVLARPTEVVALDLDVEVELLVGSRAVLEEGEPFAVVLANTHVKRGRVANRLGTVSPLTSLLGGNTLGVDVVLSRGVLALPLEVILSTGAGEGVSFATLEGDRDGLSFGTYYVVVRMALDMKRRR